METCATKLMDAYKDDIDILLFKEKLIHFFYAIESGVENVHTMHMAIIDGLQSIFSKVEIIFKIFLTMPVTNTSGVRLFSVLNRVKICLRNSLGQSKLIYLIILT